MCRACPRDQTWLREPSLSFGGEEREVAEDISAGLS